MKNIFIVVTSLTFFISCSAKKVIQPLGADLNTTQGIYAWGQYYLQQNNFEKAIELFYEIVEDFEDDALADDAQFLIAQILGNPKNPDYDLDDALSEYENLIDNYPESSFVKVARKKIAQIEKKLEKEE